ncbi:MAG: formylmethanofuran dehydrogenase subunit B [Methanospirillum sp.]|nr:formylmethanofuran dehydrogenase subunit B [Methanospirillum sp.]
MAKTVTDVTCPFCGSLCDDIEVQVSDDGTKVLEVFNACAIGAAKFLHTAAKDRVTRPRMRQEDGSYKEVSYDEAIEYTAHMFVNSKKPLMYGWSNTNCEAQSVGHEIAEATGGIVDNTATVCHGPSLIAIQDVGIPSCTLGEIKNRADVVLFWGCNPAHAHPRHLSKYSIFPRGFFTGKGHKGRKMIVVDPRNTDTMKLADVPLQLEQGRDYELLSAFRVAIRGEELPEKVAGIPREKIYEAVEVMKNGRFGVIFFGMGVTQSLGKNHNIDNAIMVTKDMNEYTKFAIIAMRGHYNVTGSGQVMGWQWGFPFATDLSRGFARYNPGETTSNDLLRRREVDAIMVFASDPGSHFPISSVREIAKIPSVAVVPDINPTTEISKLHVPVAVNAIETGGCCYRMDNVPIDARKVVEPPEGMLTDLEFLTRVRDRIAELKAQAPAGVRASAEAVGA